MKKYVGGSRDFIQILTDMNGEELSTFSRSYLGKLLHYCLYNCYFSKNLDISFDFLRSLWDFTNI